MGLFALLMMKDAGAAAGTGAATGSDSGGEQVAAEAGNGIATGVKDPEGTGPSQRGKASSGNSASNSTSEADNQHLLNTLALLLFTGLGAIQQEPGKESGASVETESLLPKDGRTDTGTEIAASAQPAAGGQAAQSADALGRETVASAGSEPKEFAARLFGAGTDAASSTGTTAVRAEFAFTPAGKAGPEENSLTPQTSAYWAPASNNSGHQSSTDWSQPAPSLPASSTGTPASPLVSANAAWASGQTNLAGEQTGSVQDGAATGTVGAGGASQDGVATIVKEMAPLLAESRDGNTSHDKAAGIEIPGGKEGYPVTLDEHVSMNNGLTQEQQVSGQPGSSGAIAKFDQIMEQVGSGASPHDLTVRLSVGNDESLVLGLKDLGQTVTVDVRASNQGMINLLQSQRDVIIRHLEGKDISANIVIDPHASGTPGKRDRRETKQGTLAARGKKGATGFNGLLEIFA
jgi:hypothetical protein